MPIRMIAVMRLILALSALVITYVDPAEPARYVSFTYAALILYCAYSSFIYLLVTRNTEFSRSIMTRAHWLDVAWYVLLIALTGGANSIFFLFFFFSILVASFQSGTRSGMSVVIVSLLLFTVVGYTMAPAHFELNRFLLRPACLLIMADPGNSEHSLRRVDRRDPEGGMHAVWPDHTLSRQLLALPQKCGVVYSKKGLSWTGRRSRLHLHGTKGKEQNLDVQETTETLADLLESGSFITVPLHAHNETRGRVYLTTQRASAFHYLDAEFLQQAFEQVLPVLDNIRLVDRLASSAAEEERQRIARNIHDSVIQPYLGLQLGLIAFRQDVETRISGSGATGQSESEDAASTMAQIDRLIEMTNQGIEDLRYTAKGLKQTGDAEGVLLPSVRTRPATRLT